MFVKELCLSRVLGIKGRFFQLKVALFLHCMFDIERNSKSWPKQTISSPKAGWYISFFKYPAGSEVLLKVSNFFNNRSSQLTSAHCCRLEITWKRFLIKSAVSVGNCSLPEKKQNNMSVGGMTI